MLELSGIPRQDNENAIELVNKTGICNFDVSQIGIAHRVSEKGTAPIIVLFNRKADITNFYRQKKKLFKVQANDIVKPNNEDHSDSEVSLPGLEQENSYIYMNESLTINQHLKFVFIYLLMTLAYCVYSNKSYKKMEIEVDISTDNIKNWLKANKLTLNIKKSNLLVFDSRKNGKEKPPVKLFINDEELEQKDFAKYLGVYFDKQLSWCKHIEITNKLHKGIGILAKLCKYVQEETMKNLFNSFLKPYIKYGNLAWGGTPKAKIELINRSIECSIRAMMNMDKFDSVKLFYEYLNILPFKDNMKLLQGKFMWKLVNAVCPNSISEKFPLTYSKAINNHQNKPVIP